jgi:pimeloyl-ACP methyl ester carboxylesterase
MTELAYTRRGSGEPLVLLHGIGSSRSAWQPVLPALAARFDVIAVDLPGFGASAPLSPETEPAPAALAAAVADTLNQLGVTRAHVAGNSLGGWVALELAARYPVRSLTLLSPAGLWRRHTPWYCRVSLRFSRFVTRYLGPLLRFAVRWRVGRLVVFAQMIGRPTRMTVAQARTAITDIGTCRGFRTALRATLCRRYLAPDAPPNAIDAPDAPDAPDAIDVPVTLAFGTRDRVLRKRQSRHRDQLPPQTVVVDVPGAGHVPMSDNPSAIADLILATAARARSAQSAR